MSFKTPTRILSGFFLGALFLAGCGGGGGGGGGAGGVASVSTDMLITDATVDELLAFRTTISSIAMVTDTGIVGSNIMVAPVTIDLIGAGASPRWVSREDLPEGTFRGVALTLAPGSSTAIDRAGAAVSVTQTNSSFELPFATPVAISSGSYHQIVLDIDLSVSLSGSAATPPILFDPAGTAALGVGAGSSSVIDEVKGIVRSTDSGNNQIFIDAFSDGDLSLPLGRVTVNINGSTLLLNDDGTVFANSADFFNALFPSTTLLEVHGSLVGGSITSTRVEIENNGGGASHVVKIDGRIANLDTLTNSFDLEIIEIEKGSSLATPAINGATSTAIAYTNQTSIVLDEHTPTTEASLAEGQRVKVKFPTFVNAPFPASQIEIDEQPEFEGNIVSVVGLPNTITIHLESDEPAILSGQVNSSGTDVTVNLTGSTLFLDTHAQPTISNTQLQPGLKLEVHGAINGPSNGPTITATRTKIHAGRFKGDVTAVFSGLHSFNADMTDLKDPFGNSVNFGSVSVNFDPSCRFLDDASNEIGFFALFNGLSLGETLEVEVFGLGTITTPDEILCYEIKSRVH